MRQINVISSETQTRVAFESEANTVAELLQELDSRNINYKDKILFEGISHSTIETNVPDGILPHGNTYRGTVTDDLVIMITAGKKIKSGMVDLNDRHALYAFIKDNQLQQDVLNKFGISYTNLKTNVLADYVASKASNSPEEENCSDVCPFAHYFLGFVALLLDKELISPKDLLDLLEQGGAITYTKNDDKKPEVKSNFSNEDINKMFSNISIE